MNELSNLQYEYKLRRLRIRRKLHSQVQLLMFCSYSFYHKRYFFFLNIRVSFKHYWGDKKVWGLILDALMGEAEYAWLMKETSFVKVYQHAYEAVRAGQDIGLSKEGELPRCICRGFQIIFYCLLISYMIK